MNGWLDRFGGLVSAICAVHCVAVALVPALITGLGFGFVASAAFEWAFVGMATVVAALAGVVGLRHHGSLMIGTGFVAGIVLLFASRFAEQAGVEAFGLVLALLGGGTLVASHLGSLRLARCEHSHA